MDTQNTPIHIHLWNKDFWKLALANLLLSISVYMMIPMTGRYTALHEFSPMTRGLIMGSTGIGLFLFGPFVNYLIQRYRRNQVCLYAMTAVAIIELLTMQVQSSRLLTGQHLVYSLIGLRILLGAAFGLSQMVMVSTLVIDLCESLHRTEANYALSWFGRFALSLGPLLVTMLYNASVAPQWIYYTAMAITFFSILLVNRIKFPFKTPEDDVHLTGTDRFFLPRGKWLFLLLTFITVIVGILLTLPLTPLFFGMMMAGFFLSLLAEKFAFADANLRSETVTGLLAIIAALLILLSDDRLAVLFISPILFGFGIGIIGSRLLLFFIKLTTHCQRGTSQSSFFLAWETGIAVGLFIGCTFLVGRPSTALLSGVAIAIVALILYNLFVHTWYVEHKNR